MLIIYMVSISLILIILNKFYIPEGRSDIDDVILKKTSNKLSMKKQIRVLSILTNLTKYHFKGLIK